LRADFLAYTWSWETGEALLKQHPNAQRGQRVMAERKSFIATR
jgi:hypothetical protein